MYKALVVSRGFITRRITVAARERQTRVAEARETKAAVCGGRSKEGMSCSRLGCCGGTSNEGMHQTRVTMLLRCRRDASNEGVHETRAHQPSKASLAVHAPLVCVLRRKAGGMALARLQRRQRSLEWSSCGAVASPPSHLRCSLTVYAAAEVLDSNESSTHVPFGPRMCFVASS
jgi:hypothetical protein